MWAPPGVRKYKGECWKLLSSIYGTKQAGADWKRHWIKILKEFGFKPVNSDETVLILKQNKEDSTKMIVVCIYVDDCIIVENWASKLNALIQHFEKHVEITNEGSIHWYLSVRYQYSVDKKRLFASQTAYIEKAAIEFGIDPNDCTGPITPMSEKFEIKPEDIPDEPDPVLVTKMKKVIGTEMFPAGWTRPEIAFPVAYLARHAHNPCEKAYDEAIRVLRYMVRTKERGICFSSDESDFHGHKRNQLYAYCDASWGDDRLNRRSTTGYVIFLNGAPIAWRVKSTPMVAGSTAHAEYVAANYCAEDVCRLREMLKSLGFEQHDPTPIYEDNEAAIKIASGTGSSGNRHIDIKYHLIRDHVRLMNIVLVPTSTLDQWADGFTKAVGRVLFQDIFSNFVFDEADVLGTEP